MTENQREELRSSDAYIQIAKWAVNDPEKKRLFALL